MALKGLSGIIIIILCNKLNEGRLLPVDCSNLPKEGLIKEVEPITLNMTSDKEADINDKKLGVLNTSFCRVDGKSNSVISDAEVGQLNLNSSMLKSIPNNWLQRFTNLNTLDLSKNHLKFLTSQSFAGLSKLRELDLSLNKLTRLIQIWFKPLTALVKLKINHCGVRYFQPSGFEWPATLVSLSLQNNSLRFMPPLPLGTSRNKWFPWEVYLQWNDIRCNCRRKEHTKITLNFEIFTKVYSSCLSQEFTTNWQVLDSTSYNKTNHRVATLWEKYVNAPLCQGPNNSVYLETNCDIDGICTANCESKENWKPRLKFNKGKGILTGFTPKENPQVVMSNFTLGSDLTKVNCEVKMLYFTMNAGLKESNEPSNSLLPSNLVLPPNMTATAQTDQQLVLCYEQNVSAITLILIITVLMTVISNILLIFLVFTYCKKSSNEENCEEGSGSDIIKN